MSSVASTVSAKAASMRSNSSMVLPMADAIWSRSARARAAKNSSKSSARWFTSARWVETCFLIVSGSTPALLASWSRYLRRSPAPDHPSVRAVSGVLFTMES